MASPRQTPSLAEVQYLIQCVTYHLGYSIIRQPRQIFLEQSLADSYLCLLAPEGKLIAP